MKLQSSESRNNIIPCNFSKNMRLSPLAVQIPPKLGGSLHYVTVRLHTHGLVRSHARLSFSCNKANWLLFEPRDHPVLGFLLLRRGTSARKGRPRGRDGNWGAHSPLRLEGKPQDVQKTELSKFEDAFEISRQRDLWWGENACCQCSFTRQRPKMKLALRMDERRTVQI